ncbi:MAG: hypothetical protein MR660_01675 [Peptoniphilaceae bacterium]|nr:hypothetical protein [Peptoniphilaceae bacterium]MCI6660495.1 hypothetical protein [Peptoniphilaceae bacterium]MDY3986822.1 hypothetical protein [Peptoniphilaceae bacterium]MDY4196482.1 hypothetical protein [Peptoniphilaceae bacterium]MDY5841604.1 hypothetical protein [Peptoniphilaceae bacterium]
MAKEAIRDILAAEEQARKRIQDAKEQGKSLMEEQKQRLETQKKQRLAQIHKENEEFLQKAEAEERRAVDPLLKEAEKKAESYRQLSDEALSAAAQRVINEVLNYGNR